MTRNILILICTLSLLTGCDRMAHWGYGLAMDLEQSRAGLEPKQASVDSIDWHYLANNPEGERPVVLLVHGFGADATNWLRFVAELEDEYRVVVPDLPGHGRTTANLDMDYSLGLQAGRLLRFMESIDAPRFHVVGSSMGGAIALEMARQAPERVASMGLMNAGGLGSRTEEFSALLTDGGNPLIVREADDIFQTAEWAMEKPPWTPEFIIRIIGEQKAELAPVTDKVWRDIMDDPSLEPALPGLNVPALVMWGTEDRLLPVADAERFHRQLPDSRIEVLEGIGHLPMMEAPEASASSFRAYWGELAGEA